jgi:hypothetical protein
MAWFDAPDPLADPVGAVAWFEPERAAAAAAASASRILLATVSRLIPSVRAIRRWGQPL